MPKNSTLQIWRNCCFGSIITKLTILLTNQTRREIQLVVSRFLSNEMTLKLCIRQGRAVCVSCANFDGYHCFKICFRAHDVIKWKHFSRHWPFVRRIHRPVNSPDKGQWRGALMFSMICAWINGWVNNRQAGDLRRNRAHYDVTVMLQNSLGFVIQNKNRC